MISPFQSVSDIRLYYQLPHLNLLSPAVDTDNLPSYPGIRHSIVQMPDHYRFLHEAAVISYHGILFAAWYNNEQHELKGYTPIRGRMSRDDGRTWSPVRTLVDVNDDGFLCCPPVFGIDDDVLYMFINRMTAPDHIHSLELYRYDEAVDRFMPIWSRPIPFKLNTNTYTLMDGRLFLPGRIAEKIDMFPDYPACLISDSGKINAEWRAVRLQELPVLPDGVKIGHAECSAVIIGREIYVFCREDTHTIPLLYRSSDSGENWTGPYSHDIPLSDSKIYSGTLSDGRNYVIGNVIPGRRHLAIFFAEPGTMSFTSGYTIHYGEDPELGLYPQWSYPVAWENDGKLYVIYTMQTDPLNNIRGAILSVLPLR